MNVTEVLSFWAKATPIKLLDICLALNGQLSKIVDPEIMIHSVAPLDLARKGEITFLDNLKYLPLLENTKASACLISPQLAAKAPENLPLVIVNEPYLGMAKVSSIFFPDALKILGTFEFKSKGHNGIIHSSAQLEENIVVETGAVVGENAEIGSGSVINANAIVGAGVKIGRNCTIGAGASIVHSLIGNDVIIHSGARIGQDGFGFAMGALHTKVPQIGRVIIQDHVEIGANTCIDRGTLRDTFIGEGTKIDNLVQIAHNVEIGRHCIIVSQCGISGSTIIEDYVVLGGKVGTVGHIRIGKAAQIAGGSNVKDNIPAGSKWGGSPAKPFRQYARELSAVKILAQKSQIGEDK